MALAEFLFGPCRVCFDPVVKDPAKTKSKPVWTDPQRLKKLRRKPIDAVMADCELELGDVAVDKITGFKGVLTCRFYHINGCLQYEVTPEKLEKGVPVEPQVFDEQRLAVKGKARNVKARQLKGLKKKPGGPPCERPSYDLP